MHMDEKDTSHPSSDEDSLDGSSISLGVGEDERQSLMITLGVGSCGHWL